MWGLRAGEFGCKVKKGRHYLTYTMMKSICMPNGNDFALHSVEIAIAVAPISLQLKTVRYLKVIFDYI